MVKNSEVFNFVSLNFVSLKIVFFKTILFLSFRRVVNVIYSFLGNSPASEI